MEFATESEASVFYKEVEKRLSDKLSNFTSEEIEEFGLVMKEYLRDRIIDEILTERAGRPLAVYSYNYLKKEYQYDENKTKEMQAEYDRKHIEVSET